MAGPRVALPEGALRKNSKPSCSAWAVGRPNDLRGADPRPLSRDLYLALAILLLLGLLWIGV